MDVVAERFQTRVGATGQVGVAHGLGVLPKAHVHSHPDLLDQAAKRLRGRGGATYLALVLGDLASLVVVTAGTTIVAKWLGLHPAAWVLAILCLGLGVLYLMAGFYHRLVVHPAMEMRDMMRATTFAVLGVFVGLRAGGVTETDLVVGLFGLIAIIVVPVTRALVRIFGARTSWWGIPVVVISYDGMGREIVNGLRRWAEMGLRPIALFERRTSPALSDTEGVEDDLYMGEPKDSAYIARNRGIRNAIISLSSSDNGLNADRIRYYTKMFKQVYMLREGCGKSAFWAALPVREGFAGVFMTNVHASYRGYRLLKRALDVLGSLAVGIVLLPLLLILSVLIRVDSRGPVLFKQLRMGRAGRIYSVYKFRTMHPDSEERLTQILASDEERKREYVAFHKLSDDPRITRVGSFLRRYSLDELPQLWNVLVGDMSLVGPRAYIPGEISDMVGLERVVLQMRPGITGLWQVSGRNELSFQTRVDLDGEYVQNATLWLDLYIIVRTFPVVLTGQGAG